MQIHAQHMLDDHWNISVFNIVPLEVGDEIPEGRSGRIPVMAVARIVGDGTSMPLAPTVVPSRSLRPCAYRCLDLLERAFTKTDVPKVVGCSSGRCALSKGLGQLEVHNPPGRFWLAEQAHQVTPGVVVEQLDSVVAENFH